jgi:hypothetical protein
VWRGAEVLRRCWSPSPCLGAAPCGLCLVAGGVTGAAAGLRRLQSEAALIDVRLDVGSLQTSSSSPTVAGCRLGGFSVGRDWWGGERIVGGVLPRINIGTWGLCDRLCLVLVCRARTVWGGGSSLHSGIEFGRSRTGEGSSGGRKRGGVRSGPGEARTILFFHTISARPPKQPRMVRTFLKVHTRPRLAYALQCRGY